MNTEMTETATEISRKRVNKYQEKITMKPKCRNQLLVKNGKAILVKEGIPYECSSVKGYIKLPEMEYMMQIQDIDIVIHFAPRQRMIIAKDDKVFFRGYRSLNAQNSFILVQAINQYYNLLIADISDEIPALIAIDDGEDENSVNILTYKMLEYMLKNSREKLGEIKVCEVEEEDDEWE